MRSRSNGSALASPEPKTADSAGRVPDAEEKTGGWGANVRLRYAPGALLGEGGEAISSPACEGSGGLRGSVPTSAENRSESRPITRCGLDCRAGVESGSLANRVVLEFPPEGMGWRSGCRASTTGWGA